MQRVPIVTMRVASINGTPASTLMGSSSRFRPDSVAADSVNGAAATAEAARDQPSRDTTQRDNAWAFRREYRSTYRAELVPTERIVSGKWSMPDYGRPSQSALERGSPRR